MTALHLRAGFPLPFLEEPSFQPLSSRSRRLASRSARGRFVLSSFNCLVWALNFLSGALLSSSLDQPMFVSSLSSSPPAFRPLWARVTLFVKRCSRQTAGVFGGAPSSHSSVFYQSRRLASAAIPLVSSHLSLPPSDATVPLLPLLPPEMASLYADVSSLLVGPPPPLSSVFPRPLCAAGEWALIVRRLLSIGMVVLLPRAEVRVVNGVFGVPKPDGATRLVIDARPVNDLFVEPRKVLLPTPDLLANQVLPPGSRLIASKTDLADFYHCLQLPSSYSPFFALPPVRPADVGAVSVEDILFPCLRSLPMGFSHAVLLAQEAHEFGILQRCPSFSLSRRLSSLSPSSLLASGLPIFIPYVDDLVLLCSAPSASETAPAFAQVQAASDEYTHAVASVRLAVKRSKFVPPTDTSVQPVEILGIQLDGLLFGLSPVKMLSLISDTYSFLSLREASGVLLEHLVGRWTWCLLPCRPALSVLSAVYRFIAVARWRVFSVWPSVRLEMRALIGLAPLLYVDLGTSWCPWLTASDASLAGAGVAYFPLSSPVSPFSVLPSDFSFAPPSSPSLSVPPLPAVVLFCLPLSHSLRGGALCCHSPGAMLVLISTHWKHLRYCWPLRGSRLARWLGTADALFWSIRLWFSLGSRKDGPLLFLSSRCLGVSRRCNYSLIFGSILCGFLPIGIPPTLSRAMSDPHFLQRAAIAPSTLRIYSRAVVLFFQWFAFSPFSRFPLSASVLDRALSAYAHHLFRVHHGTHRHLVEGALWGLIHFCPHLSGHFYSSILALRGWRRLQPSVSWLPVPAPLVALVSFSCGLFARALPQASQLGRSLWRVGFAALLAFDTYMRISELSSFLPEHVVVNRHLRPFAVAILLPTTKTGANQYVLVREPVLAASLLRMRDVALLDPVQRRSPLLGISAPLFRHLFSRLCSLWLPSLRFTPHGLRHGGACSDFLRGLPIADIKVRGRWRSDRSLVLYLQAGRNFLLSQSFSPVGLSFAHVAAQTVFSFYSLPQFP